MRQSFLIYGLLISSIAGTVSAQSPLTVISETISRPDGSHPSGTAVISWGRFMDDSVPRKSIPPGSKTISIVNGVVSTSLFPSTVTLPVSCYKIDYRLSNVTSLRYWTVPVSTVPVNLNTIESSVACSTQGGATVALGQITASGATVNQVPIYNGFYWAPGNQSGGGGGGTPGGVSGQLQYNNAGSFGGLTLGGDCTFSVPNITCTKTGGVSFAPSATTDTTNATNLLSGLVPVARLSAIPNSALTNSSVTVNTSSPLAGGGAVALGASITLSCPTCGGLTTVTLTGDVTGTGAGTVPTTLQNIPAGTPMVSLLATNSAAPVVPPTGKSAVYVDGPSKNIAVEDDAGIIKHGVQTKALVANNFLTSIDDAGSVGASRPTCGNLSDSAASCSTDTTVATNISSGTLPAARLPAINLAASGAGGVTGNLPVTNLNGGTGASAATVWCGNGTWCSVAGLGTVTNSLGALTAARLVIGNNGSDITVLPTLGTTTTLLHGNAAGNPTFSAVSLTADVTGTLPFANGGLGTNTNFTNHFFFGNNSGSAAAPVAVQPTFADLAAGAVGARATFSGGNLFCGGVNVQTGTTYAMLTTDECKLTTFNNGSAVAVSLSQATTSGFTSGAFFDLYNIGAGAVTVTPATSTINGGLTIVLNQNQGARIVSDGTNYSAWISAAPSGSGTVTNIQTTSPITGGTITTTGTIACATCVTSAASLTNIQLVIGSGSQGIHTLGSSGTTAQVLHGNGVGDPSYGSVVNADIAAATIDLTAKVTGILPVANGGSGAATFTVHGVLLGETTSAFGVTAAGTSGQCLTSNGASADPTYQGCANAALSNLASVSINTSLLAQTGVDLGSTVKPFRDLFLFGGGTFGTNYFRFTGTPTSTRTLTIPDVTATLVVAATSTTTTQALFATATAGAPAYRAIAAGDLPATLVLNNQTNTGTSAMTLDLSASTSAAAVRDPNIAGASSTTAGVHSYDTTNKNAHYGANSVDNLIVLVPSASLPADNDCAKWSVTTSIVRAISAGGGCMVNPMTTAGDLIVGGSSGTPTRLAKGTDGQLLAMVAGSVTWVNPAAVYTTTVTASTSTTVLAATHGEGVAALGFCFDNSSPAVAVACNYTRNGSGDLVFSFSPAFTGTLEIISGAGGGGGGGGGSGNLGFQLAGTSIGSRPNANFISGSGFTFVLADNPGSNRVDITGSYNSALIPTHDTIHANELYLSSINGTTTYTVTAPNKAITSYATGMAWLLRVDTTCASSCTLAIDGLTGISLKLKDGTSNPGGLLIANQPQWVWYDGTVFRLMYN